MSARRPTGTVTLVFTDIEGSTELLKRSGDAYGEIVAAHRAIIREELTSRDGVEVDTQGDSFFFVFVRAADAVAAAVAAQRRLADHAWPDGLAVRVRMSLHTGEPAATEEGYIGLDVVRAARICATGHGGQVLLSAATAGIVAGALPVGVRERSLGAHALRDLDEPEEIHQLEIEGLRSSFPLLRSADEEPLDFGARIERHVQSHVEAMVVQALENPDELARVAPRAMRLAAGGLLIAFLTLVLLVGLLVLLVLVVRLLV